VVGERVAPGYIVIDVSNTKIEEVATVEGLIGAAFRIDGIDACPRAEVVLAIQTNNNPTVNIYEYCKSRLYAFPPPEAMLEARAIRTTAAVTVTPLIAELISINMRST
jgi:hypothetical protein